MVSGGSAGLEHICEEGSVAPMSCSETPLPFCCSAIASEEDNVTMLPFLNAFSTFKVCNGWDGVDVQELIR